jgi:hypothetical protein
MMGRLKRWWGWWKARELNPVVVKELRQAVRSWAVTSVLLLFLAVLFVAMLGFLISQSFGAGLDTQLGARVFQSLVVILTGASMLFIPLYVGVRLAAERRESDLDLMYITTLTPGRIIRGKFLSGAYMAVLFFSACMPFMVFTNLLRGVDLPTIFLILLCLFLAVCAAVQLAIFLACLPVSRVFKNLLALAATVFMLFFIGPLVVLFLQMTSSGVGSRFIVGASGPNLWPGVLSTVALVLAAVGLLYFLSVALVSPVTANRALPLRSYISVVWLLSGAASFWWVWKQRDARMLLPWATNFLFGLSLALAVVVSSRDRLSYRVRRRIPIHPMKRAVAFLFFNGAAGGLLWAGLLLGATFAVVVAVLHRSVPGMAAFSTLAVDDLHNFDVTTGAVLLYALAYALTALFIHRRWLSRRTSRLAGVLTILLPAVWAILPSIVYFLFNRLSWQSVEGLQVGNVFNLLFLVKDETDRMLHVYFAAGWLALVLVLNLRWFARQLQCFQPPGPAEAPPVITGPDPSPATGAGPG